MLKVVSTFEPVIVRQEFFALETVEVEKFLPEVLALLNVHAVWQGILSHCWMWHGEGRTSASFVSVRFCLRPSQLRTQST